METGQRVAVGGENRDESQDRGLKGEDDRRLNVGLLNSGALRLVNLPGPVGSRDRTDCTRDFLERFVTHGAWPDHYSG